MTGAPVAQEDAYVEQIVGPVPNIKPFWKVFHDPLIFWALEELTAINPKLPTIKRLPTETRSSELGPRI